MTPVRLCLSLIFLALFSACSNMSQNLTMGDSSIISGGVFEDREWDETMKFRRMTWFKELSMLFDVRLAELNLDSPFANWMTEDEKKTVRDCGHFLISLSYALDSKRLSQSMYKKQMVKNGYRPIYLPNFSTHLKLHPDYSKSTLKLYRIVGYCSPNIARNEVSISFPGYKDQSF